MYLILGKKRNEQWNEVIRGWILDQNVVESRTLNDELILGKNGVRNGI